MPRTVNNTPEAVAKRKLASGLDCIRRQTLEDEKFWVEHVSIETTAKIQKAITSAMANRKVIVAEKALKQLTDLGVALPKGFTVKFNDTSNT